MKLDDKPITKSLLKIKNNPLLIQRVLNQYPHLKKENEANSKK